MNSRKLSLSHTRGFGKKVALAHGFLVTEQRSSPPPRSIKAGGQTLNTYGGSCCGLEDGNPNSGNNALSNRQITQLKAPRSHQLGRGGTEGDSRVR